MTHQRAELFQSLLPKNARRHLTTSLWSANVMMRFWPGEDVVPRCEFLMSTHEFDLSRRCAFGNCAVFNPLQTQIRLSALSYVSPCTLSLLLLTPPPSQSPPHAGLFSVNESLLDPLRPASVSPGRSGLPNSTITHSIRAESGVSVPRARGLPLGLMWGCQC